MHTWRSVNAAKAPVNESATSMSYRTVYNAVSVDDSLSVLESSLLSPSPSPWWLVSPVTPGGQKGHPGSHQRMPR